ncbi:MAG: nickel-responsive regulator 1 [Candidatus Aenigmarchaeota archaeon]|nr:nickel-responsive regulator 1 [Candidatus Aenigmarchaeota archaeon]
MKIVSISMSDEAFGEMEKLQQELAFSNRSEVLRRGVRLMREELESMEKLQGHLDCILVVMHTKAEAALSKIIHRNNSLVKTHIHNNLCNDKCLEIFVMHGASEKLRNLYNELKRTKRIDYVKLIIP